MIWEAVHKHHTPPVFIKREVWRFERGDSYFLERKKYPLGIFDLWQISRGVPESVSLLYLYLFLFFFIYFLKVDDERDNGYDECNEIGDWDTAPYSVGTEVTGQYDETGNEK
nr:hypothetical protein PU94_15225 [Coprobacter secundus]